MRIVNFVLRTLLTVAALYIIVGTLLDAYYDIIIYPGRFAPMFSVLSSAALKMHEGAAEWLGRLFRAVGEGMREIS